MTEDNVEVSTETEKSSEDSGIKVVTEKRWLCKNCGEMFTDFSRFGQHMYRHKRELEATKDNDDSDNDEDDPDKILERSAREVEMLKLQKKRKELSSFVDDRHDALTIELLRELRETQRELIEQERRHFEERIEKLERREPYRTPEQIAEEKLLGVKIDALQKSVNRIDGGIDKGMQLLRPAAEKRLKRIMLEDSQVLGEGPPTIKKYSEQEMTTMTEKLNARTPPDDLFDPPIESPPAPAPTTVPEPVKIARKIKGEKVVKRVVRVPPVDVEEAI